MTEPGGLKCPEALPDLSAGKAIKKYPREKLIIATKFGIVIEDGFRFGLNGSKEHCRSVQSSGLLVLRACGRGGPSCSGFQHPFWSHLAAALRVVKSRA